MFDFILRPCGRGLLWIYNLFDGIGVPGSYVLALVIFTLLTKIVLFPLSYRGKKSTMQMTMLQGQMKRLEAQYGKDKQRYQMEVQKLYQKAGVNPMGGCLWSLLPLPILMGLYAIIRRPLYYMMGLSTDQVTAAVDAVTGLGHTISNAASYGELQVTGLMQDPTVLETVKAAVGEGASALQGINFNFLGIDLSQIPSWKFWTWEHWNWATIGLFLIPIFVTVLNYFTSRYSMKTNKYQSVRQEDKKKKKKGDEPADATDRTTRQMMIMMPIMYLIFGYMMPGGMCIYMAASAVFMMLQDKICSRMLRKKFVELEEKQIALEEQEKEEERRRKAEIAERRRLQAEEAKTRAKNKKRPKAKPGAPVNKAGRVGMRAHALGRDYDPDRYGGVTVYRDPQEIIDEAAVEAALAKKRNRRAKALEDAMDSGDLETVKRLEAVEAELAEAQEELAEELIETPEGEETAPVEETPEGETAPQEEASAEAAETPAAPDGQAMFDQLLGRTGDETPEDGETQD